MVRWTLPHPDLLDRFGGRLLLLLAQSLHLQLHRLLQGLLGGRLALGLLTLGGALVHGSRALSRGSRPLARPRTGGPLLTVGNVGLLPGLGAGLRVDARLEERSGDGHSGGKGEARIHLKARERHRGRDHAGRGRETCGGTNQEQDLKNNGDTKKIKHSKRGSLRPG